MAESVLFLAEKSIRTVPYDALSASQRVFTLIWQLEAEVNNGGFWQYFYNRSGAYAPDVPDALNKIGAGKCSVIVSQAISLIPIDAETWLNDVQRKTIVEGLEAETKAALDALDSRFYGYPDNLSSLLSAFVAANSRDFAA